MFPVHIGRCVYCGRADAPLSDEHIIPLGLDGEWKLLKASCEEHSRVTSRFELDVLRGALIVPRTAMRMRTRRPKERPTHLKVSLKAGTQDASTILPVAEHPGFFALPVFAPPGNAPTGGPTPGIAPSTFKVIYRRPTTAKLRRDVKADTFGAPFPDLISFARMIAKIGYCFAVARLGIDAVLQAPVLGAILGADSLVGNFVGCIPDSAETKTEGVHQVALAWTDQEVRAYVRIFAALRAPEYLVLIR